MTKLAWLPALLTLVLGFTIGCDEDKPVDPAPPTVFEVLDAPQFLLGNVDSTYVYRVRFQYEGSVTATDQVICHIMRPQGAPESDVGLFDDGGAVVLAGPDFASETSLDIVPGNGTYTRGINGMLLSDEETGEFAFSITPYHNGAEAASPVELGITVADIQDCVFEDYDEVHELHGCFDAVTITARLSATPPDVIDTLRIRVRQAGVPFHVVNFFPQPGDTLWQATLAPSTLHCAGTGTDYSMTYEATTRFGRSCEVLIENISIVNDDQELDNLVGLPDTLYRPPLGEPDDTIAVMVDLIDCNLDGVIGYDGVRFDVKKDDGEWQDSSIYVFSDAGVSGDTVAGDGTYTVALTFSPSETSLNNVFTFRYYSIECAPPYEQTEYLYDTVRVIQPMEALTAPSPTDPDDFGFKVISRIESAPGTHRN